VQWGEYVHLRWKVQQVDKKTRRFITAALRQILLGWSNNEDRRWEKHAARTRWETNATFQTEKVRGSETWLGLPGLDRRRVSKFVKSLTREDFGSVLVVRRHLTLPHPPLLHRGTRNCSASHHTNWNSNFRPFPITKYIAQSPYHYIQFLKGNSKHSHTFRSAITIPNLPAVV
jgi:hypothetical protein